MEDNTKVDATTAVKEETLLPGVRRGAPSPHTLQVLNRELYETLRKVSDVPFETTLVEFLSRINRDTTQVIQILCNVHHPKERLEALKNSLPLRTWERINDYVNALQTSSSTTTPPLLLLESDFDPVPTPPSTTTENSSNNEEEEQDEYLVFQRGPDTEPSLHRVTWQDMDYVQLKETLSHSLGPSTQMDASTIAHYANLNWYTIHIAKSDDYKPPPLPGTQQATIKKRKRLPLRSTEFGERVYLDSFPTNLDVMYGRGGGTNNHRGNVLYLLEKLRLQPGYILLATQKGKKVISERLVQSVQAWGGRFVDRDEHGRWYIVPDDIARKKASQTLREDKSPQDQTNKREALLKKLKEIENNLPKKARLSVQERNVSETLLQLTGHAARLKEEEGAVAAAETVIEEVETTVEL